MKYLLAFGLVAAPLHAAGSEGNVVVKIEDLKNQSGSVLCNLFNDAKNFPKEGALEVVTVKASDSAHTCTFEHVTNGEYAVAIVHDENCNGKLDTNFIGIPKEGVGSSNNIRHKMGPPEYQES